MAARDDIWRKLVNNLPELDEEGEEASSLESMPKKRPPSKRFFVQKIVTEIYVYTDLEKQLFAETTFQDLYILGEMSEAKLNKLIKAAGKNRNPPS